MFKLSLFIGILKPKNFGSEEHPFSLLKGARAAANSPIPKSGPEFLSHLIPDDL
jgi:hypothetical protein